MKLAPIEPFKPAFVGNKLSVFLEVLWDASILSKGDKQLIINNVKNELINTFQPSIVFDENNDCGLKANPLYGEENLLLAQRIAERILASSRASLCISSKFSKSIIVVHEDPELAHEAYELLHMIGKTLVHSSLPGESAKYIQGDKISVVSQRLTLDSLNRNVSFLCNSTTSFNESLVPTGLCDNFNFRFFTTFNQTGNITDSLKDSKLGSENSVDVVSIFSFLNVGDKMSPMLSITLSNLSSPHELYMNQTSPFIVLEFPVYSQRIDQHEIPSDNLTCKYLSEYNTWLEQGCRRTNNDSTFVKCECTHLTLFVLDVTAAKKALRETNAEIVLNPSDLEDISFEKVATSFAFLLIVILILINLFSILLHYMDVADKSEGKFFTQKERILKSFFPEPKEEYIDFFANGPFPKEDLVELIKVGIGLSAPPKEEEKIQRNPPVFYTTIHVTPHKEDLNKREPIGSSKGSVKSINSPTNYQGDTSQENPEVQHSRQELFMQTGSHLSRGDSSGSINSPKATPQKPRLRSSMLSTLFSSVSLSKMPGKDDGKVKVMSPAPTPFSKESTPLKIRLHIPQHASGGFFKGLWVSLKALYPLLSLFALYDPSFPRPLRMVQITTRIIGYMGTSAIFYNTTDKLRSSNEAIYVGLISSAIMLAISTALGKIFFIDGRITRMDMNMSKEVEKKVEDQLEVQSVSKHFFTMQEYYGMVIERKRTLWGDVVKCVNGCLCWKRLFGVLFSFGLDLFFLTFFVVFCSKFDQDLINSWKLSFIYSLAMDVVGMQLVKVLVIVFTLKFLQNCWPTVNSHYVCVHIMKFTGLWYYQV
eukprot:TRINITY_DN2722_c0_g1_i1.p1 TRINITY_DN2722_c0_g1~~TRINITY_DN2722_c0_g1_i1.p1  ORF type:complete len:819 (+),score=73.38 TRINITY_DN2722_c0_g1_i1:7866-10322(+)